MWLFPWASWAAVIAMGVVLLAMARTPSLAHSFWASALTLVVTAGIWYLHRYRATRSG
jgi:L-asparagine transporter-like permease